MSFHKPSTDSFREPTMALMVQEIHALRAYIHPPVPNPSPLGLFGFGLTTALLQIKTTRIAGDSSAEMKEVDNVVLGFGMFFGGLLQVIAGLVEVKRNNVFGFTAFTLYGGFWMSMATIDMVALLATGSPPQSSPDALQAVLFMMFLISAMLWILTFKLNMTICVTFFFACCTNIFLCIGVKHETFDKVGGYFGFLAAASAFWLAFSELVNDVFGGGKTEVIPLGHWPANEFKESGGAYAPGRIHGTRPGKLLAGTMEFSVHDTRDYPEQDVESGKQIEDENSRSG